MAKKKTKKQIAFWAGYKKTIIGRGASEQIKRIELRYQKQRSRS